MVYFNSSTNSRTVASARVISLVSPSPRCLSFSSESDFEVSTSFALTGQGPAAESESC